MGEKDEDKKKYPLRIDARTVIFVSKENCNEVYAQRKRMKFSKCGGRTSMNDMSF